MEDIVKIVGVTVVLIGIVFASILFGSFLTWWAWNFVVPYLFHLPQITLLQAFALNLLASCLIKPVTAQYGKK